MDSFNNIPWPVFFAIACWHLWTCRNKTLFHPDFLATSNPLHFITAFGQGLVASKLYTGALSSPKDYGLIAWSPPRSVLVKLNTDGAAKGNPSTAGAKGIIRDCTSRWLLGYYASLGICSSVVAKLEAVRIGLEVAWNEGFRDVICEVDALSIVHILSHPLFLVTRWHGWLVIVGC